MLKFAPGGPNKGYQNPPFFFFLSFLRSFLVSLISPLDDTMNYRDTPMFQDDFDLVGGRLPNADKKIVGKPDFTEVISMLSKGYSEPQCGFFSDMDSNRLTSEPYQMDA
jgi:hypothetical protein